MEDNINHSSSSMNKEDALNTLKRKCPVSNEIQGLILEEMRETRSDIKALSTRVNDNKEEITKEIHKLDKKVLGNKLKLGAVMSVLSIAWAAIINYLSKNY